MLFESFHNHIHYTFTLMTTELQKSLQKLTAEAPLSSAALERTIALSETASRILSKQSTVYGMSGSLEIS